MVLDILETVLSLPIVTFQIVACCFSYINSVANILCRHVYPDFSFLSFYIPCSFFDTVTQQKNAMEKGSGRSRGVNVFVSSLMSARLQGTDTTESFLGVTPERSRFPRPFTYIPREENAIFS